jgi:hypothetical protein
MVSIVSGSSYSSPALTIASDGVNPAKILRHIFVNYPMFLACLISIGHLFHSSQASTEKEFLRNAIHKYIQEVTLRLSALRASYEYQLYYMNIFRYCIKAQRRDLIRPLEKSVPQTIVFRHKEIG